MSSVPRVLGLGLLLVFLPALAAQEKKPADKDARPAKEKKEGADKGLPKDKKEAAEKVLTGGEISGKLVHWDANQKYFTVQVTLRFGVPNMGAINNLASLTVQRADALRRGDRNAVIDLTRRMAQEQANLVSIKEETHPLEFQASDDMKVRLAAPPPQFDDKGKLRKPTAKELAELKGPNPKLPGYTGDFNDIRTDSLVTVYLPKKKPTPAPRAPVNKDKDKDLDKPAPGTRLEAVMLLIHGELPRQ